MTDRNALTPFERRVADQMERYVVGAIDPKSASEIADAAMRPRSLWSRARHAPRSRHLLMFGLAAALLVPVAAVAGGLIRQSPTPTTTDVVRPSDNASIVQPTGKVAATPGDTAIYLRRSAAGVDVVAVRPGGDELVVRTLPDPIQGHRLMLGLASSVSESGWLALSAISGDNAPSSVILLDLRDLASQPWVVDGATVDGAAPSWGPTGLLAATTDGSDLVVVDPDAHTVRRVSMQGIPPSPDGASIIWTADGRGFVSATDAGHYVTVPLDGSKPVPGVDLTPYRDFSRGMGGQFGPGMATLEVCGDGAGCPGPTTPSGSSPTTGDDGRVDLVDTDGTQTIWRPVGGDHALAASFATSGGYWLTLDHDHGTQVVLTRVGGTSPNLTATLDRDADWRSVGVFGEFPDHSAAVAFVDPASGDQFLSVIAPLDGSPPTLHHGAFTGFVVASDLATPADGRYAAPTESMPTTGRAYALPSLDALIADELSGNAGETVLDKGFHDAVPGDTAVHPYALDLDRSDPGRAYLQCIGPSSVTVTWPSGTLTSACLSPGGQNSNVDAVGPITVEATGDTSWRVVIYSR